MGTFLAISCVVSVAYGLWFCHRPVTAWRSMVKTVPVAMLAVWAALAGGPVWLVAALGLSAVRHALRALDGRSQRTPLSLAVSDRFGHAIPQAIAWMDRATPRDYAALAPLVMDHAEAGDAIARSIVEDAAAHVERFIETVFERGAPSCVLMGGLAPRLRPWLRARTVAQLGEAQGDALDGALLLAGLPGDARAG